MKKLTFIFIGILYATMSMSQSIETEFQSVIPNDGGTSDNFGTSVCIYDIFAIVGAPLHDDPVNGTDAGAAYLYVFNSGTSTWELSHKFTASDGNPGDQFGRQVSIFKDCQVIIGAHNHTHSGLSEAGAAYIYKKDGFGNWVEHKLTANNASAGDHFGRSVSITDYFAVVGAKDEDSFGSNSGMAYVYKISGATVNFDQQLTGVGISTGDNFAQSVCVNSKRIIAGAMYDDDNGTNSGAAYVFKRTAYGWVQEAKLLANDGTTNDWFGNAVSISKNKIVIAAMLEDEGYNDSGASYIFHLVGTNWTQHSKLVPPSAGYRDHFGGSVGICGDYCIIGADANDTNETNAGLAYLYKYNSGTDTWNLENYFQSNNVQSEDWFGRGVAITNGRSIVGASKDDNSNGSDSGEAYFFNHTCKKSTNFIDSKSTLSVNLYPNPASNNLFITTEYTEQLEIFIKDVTGRVLHQENNIYEKHMIDISMLNSGLYYLVVSNANRTITKQFIKN